jgi:acetyltransferase-like isoleucine patch superfamily enzyme
MGELTMGRRSYGDPIRRGTANTVTIGNYCSIAEGVVMDGGFSHRTDFVSTFPFHTLTSYAHNNINLKGDIIIGNDVWIGESATIMSGVSIGDGAIIGMRCIVSKDVAPYEIVVGAPQKVLRKRFSDDQIEALLKIKWWDWDELKIQYNSPLLTSNNIDDFIKLHK